MSYLNSSKEMLENEKKSLLNEYEGYKAQGLSLNMARGKPSPEQLDLAMPMLDIIHSAVECKAESGLDCRNYGELEGIFECRMLFSDLLGVDPESVFIGGNSSLNMMFDTITAFMTTPL